MREMEKIRIGQIGIGHNHGGAKMHAVRKFPELFEVVGWAEENEEWVRRRGGNECYAGLPRLTPEEVIARADAVLKRLHLGDLKNRYNHKISGGEKRMAAIATVLAMEPEAVLMDEPTSALDPYNRRIVINTVRELEMTKLITSHDLDMILDTCGRVILLSEGRVAAEGPAGEILRDRTLLESNRMELPLSLAGRPC